MPEGEAQFESIKDRIDALEKDVDVFLASAQENRDIVVQEFKDRARQLYADILSADAQSRATHQVLGASIESETGQKTYDELRNIYRASQVFQQAHKAYIERVEGVMQKIDAGGNIDKQPEMGGQ